MPRLLASLAALVLAALLAGGCSLSRRPGPPDPYRLEPTRDCLVAAGVAVRSTPDVVGSTATGGAFVARIPGNPVTVAFGEDEEEAGQLERAYRRFAPRSLRIRDVLQRELNVVLLWGVSPSPQDRDRVKGCLSS